MSHHPGPYGWCGSRRDDYLRSKGYCNGDGCFIYGYWGYVPANDSDYKTVRDVCAATGARQCKTGS